MVTLTHNVLSVRIPEVKFDRSTKIEDVKVIECFSFVIIIDVFKRKIWNRINIYEIISPRFK